MSETMSNPTDQWMQFYNQTTTQPASLLVSSDASAVAAAVANIPTSARRLSPEAGRVTKPVRRRSRASRRTPTTLLNTDTTNFRAMVQQFTGGPSGPHHGGIGGAGFSFGSLGARQAGFGANPNGAAAMAAPPPALAGYHQPGVLQPQQQQSQPYMFAAGAGAGSGHETFLQRLSSGRPAGNAGGGASPEGFFMGSVGVSSDTRARATSELMGAASSDENRSNNFMF